MTEATARRIAVALEHIADRLERPAGMAGSAAHITSGCWPTPPGPTSVEVRHITVPYCPPGGCGGGGGA